MIIKYSDTNENRISWQHRKGEEWKTAELDELIGAYEREKTGEWIPVSERLPKMDGWYQCTVSVGKQQRYTMDLYFRCSNKRWIDYRRLSYYQMYELWGYGKSTIKHKITYEELDDIDRTEDVVAWTLLSEPYKESENERFN